MLIVDDGKLLCVNAFHSCILLLLLLLVLLGTLLDLRHERAASMKWDLLYHVSTNVRHLVGSRDSGRMMWTTVDESAVSSDPVTADSQTNEEQSLADDVDSRDVQRPPNARLLVEAFNYKPGPTVITSSLSSLFSKQLFVFFFVRCHVLYNSALCSVLSA